MNSSVSTFIRPKPQPEKTKRVVEVKSLKAAALKKKRDLQKQSDRERALAERKRRVEKADTSLKQKIVEKSSSSKSSSSSRTLVKTLVKPNKSVKSLSKPVKVNKMGVDDRLKMAQQRRLEAEKRKAAEREEKQKQRLMFKERTRGLAESKKQKTTSSSATSSAPSSSSGMRAPSSVLAKASKKPAAAASGVGPKSGSAALKALAAKHAATKTAVDAGGHKHKFVVPTPPVRRHESKIARPSSPQPKIEIPEKPDS